MYSYKQEKDYITSFNELTSYLHLSPPPENNPYSDVKLWRIYDEATFLYWYNKRCDYVIHKSHNVGEIELPRFQKGNINFLRVHNYSNPQRPYYYVLTQDGKLM